MQFNTDGKARRTDLYRVADAPPGYIGVSPLPHRIAGMLTGEKRAPKKGEWYLSGNPAECYRARNDLTDQFWLVMLVQTEAVTTYNVLPYDPAAEQARRHAQRDARQIEAEQHSDAVEAAVQRRLDEHRVIDDDYLNRSSREARE